MNNTAIKRALIALAGTAAAVALSSPASAQSYSKTEAILGGPSALDALKAQQNGTPVTAGPALRPASYAYARPQLTPAVFRDRPAISPGVASGRPDIFGTVALRIGHTSLDARWHSVEHAAVGGSAAMFAAAQRDKGAVERLEAVNWYVNKRVQFIDDQVRWGRPDVWSTADVTLKAGKGDCEDFAIAKLAMLRRAGIADKDLYLVILKDTVRRADHAVLVVRAAGHMYLLDNGTDEVLDSEAVQDYRPIFTFASNATFTHGYRLHQTPVNIAIAEMPAPTPAADTADTAS